MRMLILGPPGAGKGTQAARLAEHFHIPAVSTGDIFRANIKGGTALGVKVKAIIDAGRYVPDEVTNEIVFDRLQQPDATRGYLLDGYPRTAGQVEALEQFNAERGDRLDHVLELRVPVDEVVSRLLARAMTEGRSDDTEDVIRERLRLYVEQTQPLADWAAERSLLRTVDGIGDIDQVFSRCVAALTSQRPPA